MKTEPTPTERATQVCFGHGPNSFTKLIYALAAELEKAQADLKNYRRWHDQKETTLEAIKELVNDED